MLNDITNKELEALEKIRNFLMKNNRMPSVRILAKELNYKSPRSAAVLIERLYERGVLNKKSDGTLQLAQFDINLKDEHRAQTVKVPLLGTVSCGTPIFAEENIEAEISISTKLINQNHRYFLLKAEGDSMNLKGIDNGDLVLIKQQHTADNGQSVVALINDEATIKEYWNNETTIILKPKSTNSDHQPIILTNDFRIQGVVITSFSI